MKKIITLLILITIFLCGCSVTTDNNIQTLKNWSFQYNKETNDYSVFFGLCNKSDKFISADVDVDVRIVNDKDELVCSVNKYLTEKDFSYYTSITSGEQYLANIRIPASQVASGKSSSGTVYLTIKKDNFAIFDEVNCRALYCLPIKDSQLTTDLLPVELNIKGYDGEIKSKIQIDKVSYVFTKELLSVLKITIDGSKTYGEKASTYDIISYKLYDSEGYLVKSGNIYLFSLEQGDKFKDDSIIVYEITPGESYTLKFTEYK